MARSNLLVCILLIALAGAATGCSTIYFNNGGSSEQVEREEFHHIGAFGLVEFSDPAELTEECEGRDWRVVRTQLSFLAGLVGAITQPFYGPWEVAYGCAR